MTPNNTTAATAQYRETRAEAAEYQSLSVPAVLALVLGLLSPAALATPILLVVPAAACGAALIAFQQISRSNGSLTGAGVAKLGLALAVASLIAAPIRTVVRDSLLARQSDAIAQTWLQTLADGRVGDARAYLTSRATSSLLPQRSPDSKPPTAEEAEPIVLSRLASDPLAKRLADHPGPISVLPWGTPSRPEFDGVVTRLSTVYLVKSAPDQRGFYVTLQFARVATAQVTDQSWKIDRWDARDQPSEGPETTPH